MSRRASGYWRSSTAAVDAAESSRPAAALTALPTRLCAASRMYRSPSASIGMTASPGPPLGPPPPPPLTPLAAAPARPARAACRSRSSRSCCAALSAASRSSWFCF
eukprot:52878-Chlamydomonas_euryale.AAC.1